MTYKFLIQILNERIDYFGVRFVAKEASMSPATLHRIAKGKKPDLESFIKLCEYFRINVPFSKCLKKTFFKKNNQ